MDTQLSKLLLNESKSTKNYNLIQKYKEDIMERNCENNMYYIKIPNNEILECFTEILKENLKEEININENINNFINSIFSHNIDKIDFNLKTYLLNLSSYHLYEKENVYENIYQVLLMQIFIFLKEYGLTGEENSRKDQYDFGFPNKYKKDEYILIEVKFSKSKNGSNEVLKKKCKYAINQIEKTKNMKPNIKEMAIQLL